MRWKENCSSTSIEELLPCQEAFDWLIDEEVVFACERDVIAMLPSLILHAVSGQSVLMGHSVYRPGGFEVIEEDKDGTGPSDSCAGLIRSTRAATCIVEVIHVSTIVPARPDRDNVVEEPDHHGAYLYQSSR